MKVNALQAQALDNRSEDPMRIPGQSQIPDRAKVMSAISRVGASGQMLFSKQGLLLISYGQEALLQIPCIERDQAGRLAPIVCWLERGDNSEGDAKVWEEIEAFARSINRSIATQTQGQAQEALSLLAKKPSVSQALILKLVQLLPAPWAKWLGTYIARLGIFKS